MVIDRNAWRESVCFTLLFCEAIVGISFIFTGLTHILIIFAGNCGFGGVGHFLKEPTAKFRGFQTSWRTDLLNPSANFFFSKKQQCQLNEKTHSPPPTAATTAIRTLAFGRETRLKNLLLISRIHQVCSRGQSRRFRRRSRRRLNRGKNMFFVH